LNFHTDEKSGCEEKVETNKTKLLVDSSRFGGF